MSEFKTRAEMAAANEFIQFLELLKSGSLTAGDGINRALERLAENSDALLDAAQMSRSPILWGGGTVALNAAGNSLSWTADIQVGLWSNTTTDGVINFIPANPTGVTVTASDVLYFVADRTAPLPNVTLVVAPFGTFLAAVQAASNRLDYIMLGLVLGTDAVLFMDGTRLLKGENFTGGFAVDSQYAQQTEATLIRQNQQENLRIIMSRGGDLTWDAGISEFTWSDDLVLDFPGTGRNNYLAAGSATLAVGEALYVTLNRSATPGSYLVAPSVAPLASLPSPDGTAAGDHIFVIAIRKSDGRLYLWNGDALSDGETRPLGAAQSGINWMYRNVGSGSQVIDFTTGGFSERMFRTASGELMLYRNGIKARRSDAVWDGSSSPYDPFTPGGGGGVLLTVGSLNGTPLGPILPEDDYVEELGPDGTTGTRIIWLADGQAGVEALYHPPAGGPPVHDPPLEWPDAEDRIEAFIGIEGAAPTITIPDGVYGFDEVWTKDQNTIRIAAGVMVLAGTPYRNDGSSPIDVTVADMFSGDTLVPGTWHYVYLKQGVSPGATPFAVLSVTGPNVEGRHPSDNGALFLTSAYVTSGSTFSAFVKRGSEVVRQRDSLPDIAAAFAAPDGLFQNTDLSALLPDTFLGSVRLLMLAQTDPSITSGDRVFIDVKQTGRGFVGGSYRPLRPNNSDQVEQEIEVILDGSKTFDIRFAAGEFLAIVDVLVLGYSEGRFTSGSGLGV